MTGVARAAAAAPSPARDDAISPSDGAVRLAVVPTDPPRRGPRHGPAGQAGVVAAAGVGAVVGWVAAVGAGPSSLAVAVAGLVAVSVHAGAVATAPRRTRRQRAHAAATVAHDLRQPLTVVKAAAYALARHEVDPDRRARLRIIDAEADRLASIVDEFDALTASPSPSRAGRHDPDPRHPRAAAVVDLERLVAETVERFAFAAADGAVALRASVSGAAAPVRGAAATLERALANLVVNALRHAPPGGEVTVGLARDGRVAVVTVDDTGPGFDARGLRRCFDPGWQGRGPHGRAGLGLAQVRAAARAHGGSVVAGRAPGGGARLQIRLPLAEPVAEVTATPAARRPGRLRRPA